MLVVPRALEAQARCLSVDSSRDLVRGIGPQQTTERPAVESPASQRQVGTQQALTTAHRVELNRQALPWRAVAQLVVELHRHEGRYVHQLGEPVAPRWPDHIAVPLVPWGVLNLGHKGLDGG